MKLAIIILVFCSLIAVTPAIAFDQQPNSIGHKEDHGQLGSFPQWSKVEVDMTGPASVGMSESPNPFLIDVDVTFTGPGGTFVVPGYYDGDGAGGMDGNVWRARFSPNATGSWSYTSSSAEATLNGESGTFTVTAPTGCSAYVPGGLPDFSCAGRLVHNTGQHYLQFSDGTYWLKGGEDEPESWLATPVGQGCGTACGFASKNDAMTYLASKGVNSMYFMTQNIDGDLNNVWPYVGGSSSSAKTNHEHIDLAKMLVWEGYFNHMQDVGIVLHVVLEDDSGWTGFNRNLYYREMIARFGHHNGLYWNIAEEYNENYSSALGASFAALIKSIDPYDHPVTIHHSGNAEDNWAPFLGNSNFDITSFQDNISPWNAQAANWFSLVESSGHIIPVSFDETTSLSSSERNLARSIEWQVYMGGANFEVFTQPVTDFTAFATFYEDMTRARGLIETLPFYNMRPRNDLISGGTAYTFAQAGEAYITYFPTGGTRNLNLSGNNNIFDAYWFNPRDGSTQALSPVTGGSTQGFTAPDSNDWALVLEKTTGGGNVAPTANNQSATTDFETPINLTLTYTDSDGPGPYTVTISTNVTHGVLTGSGVNRTYTPAAGYDGPDSFQWFVNDGLDNSNTATFSLTVNPEVIVNNPPVAESDSIHVNQDSTSNYILIMYSDTDGPGPYTVTIEANVTHGTLTGLGNDWFYTPTSGYSGPDSFQWSVNDGLDDSNIATISITVDPPANTAPTAQSDSVATGEDTPVAITLTGTDAEQCELAFFNIVVGPAHGSLDTPANNTCVVGSPNTDTATVNYTPALGYFGPDSFTWQTNDGTINSNVATISITVNSEDATFLLSLQFGDDGGWSLDFDTILFAPAGGPYAISTPYTPTATSTGDENGMFVISVTPGIYDVWAKGETTLAQLETNVDLTGSPPTPYNLGQQAGGDFTGDNIVNGDDFIPLLLNFGQATSSLPAPDQLNDHNQNGTVDIADFRIIIGNYNSVGDAQPSCCS